MRDESRQLNGCKAYTLDATSRCFLELTAADFIGVVVNVKSFRGAEVFQRDGAFIKFQRDDIIFIRRREVHAVERERVLAVEAEDNVLAVAAVINENIRTVIAPK